MAKCCRSAPRCSCSIVAGPGVTIDGNGAGGTPYVVSAASTSTGLTVTDTESVDLTLTGTGAPGDSYNVSGVVRLDQAPPGGGTNLLQTGPDGLFIECDGVRSCITPGDGAAYDPATGEVEARLSTDPSNRVAFGTDGGLFVPPAPLPLVGCGLTGDGTPGAPITTLPAAGQEAWPWACDVAVESTLKCDPDTGALWTPPEHYSAADHVYVEHFNGGWASPIGPSGGWVIISAGANAQWNIPANFLGNQCRFWSYSTHLFGTWDINYTATAVFELGYAYTENGGPSQVRPLWGLLTAPGTARRERDGGSVTEASFNLAPDGTLQLVMWPAIRVVAGSVTINSWISDASIHTTTQS
ncbi:hypothetical protein [Streptomyces sp. NPDC058548]|uniref:hypothetical protein n=1 Tax=Streptomyces sp. NPDC058548 TaxID=3346545 RepID=UPI00365D2151